MKKFVKYSVVAVVFVSLNSCFLFRTHENCPAYGELEKEKQSTEVVCDQETV